MKNIVRYAVALLLGGLLANCSELDLPIKPATPTLDSHRTAPALSSNLFPLTQPLTTTINPAPFTFYPALVAPFAPTRVPLVPPAPARNVDSSNRILEDQPRNR